MEKAYVQLAQIAMYCAAIWRKKNAVWPLTIAMWIIGAIRCCELRELHREQKDRVRGVWLVFELDQGRGEINSRR